MSESSLAKLLRDRLSSPMSLDKSSEPPLPWQSSGADEDAEWEDTFSTWSEPLSTGGFAAARREAPAEALKFLA